MGNDLNNITGFKR